MSINCMSLKHIARSRPSFSTAMACCLASLLTAMAAGPAVAAVTVDGRFDPAEGYTTFGVDFNVEGGGTASGGKLGIYEDLATGNVSVAFVQPLTLIDNSYGSNAIGWPGDNHKFNHLIGSDKAEFVFTDGADNTVLEITMDYLHGFGHKKEDPPFHSGGVTDGDGKVDTGSAGDVLAAESSMGLNYATYGVSYPALFGKDSDSPAADSGYNVSDPALSGWLFDVIYELQVDGSVFGGQGFGGVTIPLVHDSPNKVGGHKVYPDIGGNGYVIPEPTGLVIWSLLGTLAITLAWRRRRRKPA